MSFTLDLFAETEPAPVVTAHIPGFEKMKPETQQALGNMVQAVYDAADRGELPSIATTKKLGLDHAMYAFIAQAKHYGMTDPSLTPACVTEAGQRIYEEAEVARYANELLRGVRSVKPTMTKERWALAIQKVRELGGQHA
jgi:hypothetical protein